MCMASPDKNGEFIQNKSCHTYREDRLYISALDYVLKLFVLII